MYGLIKSQALPGYVAGLLNLTEVIQKWKFRFILFKLIPFEYTFILRESKENWNVNFLK